VTDTVPGGLPAEMHLSAADPGFRAGLLTWLRVPLDGCTPGAVREAAIVLGELVGNAFEHAKPPYRVTVGFGGSGHLIRLAVTDGSPRGTADWQLGRGLRVVRGTCHRWGVDQTVTGKTVWAVLRVLVPPHSP
jgi:two-component sensor histidine kinase